MRLVRFRRIRRRARGGKLPVARAAKGWVLGNLAGGRAACQADQPAKDRRISLPLWIVSSEAA